MEKNKTYRVFYSWQSDSPKETNLYFIRESLKSVSSQIKEIYPQENIEIYLDEATRDIPGSPNIPNSIFSKIQSCDIFICDITTINPNAPFDLKRTPNPNVLIELGFAISEVGWNRIIMLLNRELSSISDTPFDMDRQRISIYNCPIEKPVAKDKELKKNLDKLLYEAISLILKTNPSRPIDLKSSPEQIKKHRDEKNILELLHEIHFESIFEFISTAPHIIPSSIFYFWEGFKAIIDSNSFFLYDTKLFKLFNEMYLHWGDALAHGSEYELMRNGINYIFKNEMDLPLPRERKKNWDAIELSTKNLYRTLKNILSHLRENYFSIDIDQINKEAWKRYVQFHKDIKKELK